MTPKLKDTPVEADYGDDAIATRDEDIVEWSDDFFDDLLDEDFDDIGEELDNSLDMLDSDE